MPGSRICWRWPGCISASSWGWPVAATRFGLALWERAALYWPTRQIAALAALAAGAGYLALTGAHVPILRSFAMAAVVTLGVLTGRRAVSLRGLALACLVLMVLSPASVVGVSFQMSFAAVLTLIAGYELARPALARLGRGCALARPALSRVGPGADQPAGRHRVAALRGSIISAVPRCITCRPTCWRCR